MNNSEIQNYFDQAAAGWDAGMRRNETVIAHILDNAGVREGADVLDVACGTGVLIPDYLARGAASVLGVDISGEMIRIAEGKFQDPRVSFLRADAATLECAQRFDCIVVYNAFPHFVDQKACLAHLAGLLKDGGTLTVAHGMSREKLIAHHHNVMNISHKLVTAEELAAMMPKELTVRCIVSDENMYQVAARKESAR